MAQLSDACKSLFDIVSNPFNTEQDARVPDDYTGKTVCLTDYNYMYQPLVDVNTANASIANGLLLVMLPYYSKFKNDKATYGQAIWTVLQIFTLNGIPIDSGTSPGKFGNIVGANYETITGDDTGYNDSLSLCESVRLFAAGMRAWPVIEYVTDSTTLYAVYFQGGYLKPTDLYQFVSDGSAVDTLVRNAQHLGTFANSQGITVRYDPFMLPDLLRFRTLEDLALGNTLEVSDMPIPFIFMNFSQDIALESVCPIYFSVQYWLEGTLAQPTPIYSDMSPMDLGFEMAVKVYKAANYPVVVEGHSFKGFLKTMAKFTGAANKAVGYATDITEGNYSKAAAQLAKDTNRLALRYEKRPKKKRNRKKKRRKGGYTPNGFYKEKKEIGNNKLNYTYRPSKVKNA